MTNTSKAILYMAIAMAMIPMIDVFAKFLGDQGLPVAQLVWARFFFGALFTLPLAWKLQGASVLRPEHLRYHSIRAALLILGTCFFFGALQYLPIADTLAITFIQPIIVTALSPFVLKEHVGIHRWSCVVLGFIGVLIIIRPGFQAFNLGVILALGAGLCSACYMLLTRSFTGNINAMIATFHTTAIGACVLTLLMPFVWISANINQWLMLVGIGAFAIIATYLTNRAYDMAEASLISPLGYLEIITSVLLGWYFFNNFPDGYTFIGVAILIACALYISFRERLKAKAVA